jgi:hypothetical protein
MAGQPIGRSTAETLYELTPDVLLDRIDGLQTQVAIAETETETARTVAREVAQAAEGHGGGSEGDDATSGHSGRRHVGLGPAWKGFKSV